MDSNDLTYKIRGAIFTVFTELGPGLLESVYEAALMYELKEQGLEAKNQVAIPIKYKNIELENGFRIDILVENEIILELKSVEILQNIHKKQLLTYLKLSGLKLGFLINFNCERLISKENLIRIING